MHAAYELEFLENQHEWSLWNKASSTFESFFGSCSILMVYFKTLKCRDTIKRIWDWRRLLCSEMWTGAPLSAQDGSGLPGTQLFSVSCSQAVLVPRAGSSSLGYPERVSFCFHVAVSFMPGKYQVEHPFRERPSAMATLSPRHALCPDFVSWAPNLQLC